MASILRLLCVPLFGFAVVAQGAHQSVALLGKWKVKSVSVPASGPEAQKAKEMMMKSTLLFSRDRTFEMTLGGQLKGTWKVSGHEVSLAITEMMGTKMSEIVAMARSNYANEPSPRHKAALDELSKPLKGTLSPDGKTLTLKPSPGKAKLVFMRA